MYHIPSAYTNSSPWKDSPCVAVAAVSSIIGGLRGDDLSGTALDDSEVLALRRIRWDKNMGISWGYIVYIYIYII